MEAASLTLVLQGWGGLAGWGRVIRLSPAGVWFLSLAMILAGGSLASGVSLSSLLLVLMSMILGCWALELSMMGYVARARWSV